MKSILKDLQLESLIPAKFAAERIEPENVSGLSDDELVRPSWCNNDRRQSCSCPLCLRRKKYQSMAAAALSERMALFSGRSGSSRRGGRGEKRKLSSMRVEK